MAFSSLLTYVTLFILGDDPKRTFGVEILKEKNVGSLKPLIKEKITPYLDHISTKDLDLWLVSFLINDLKTALENLNFASYRKLSPHDKKLSTFFTDVLDGDYIHVIAGAPGMS